MFSWCFSWCSPTSAASAIDTSRERRSPENACKLDLQDDCIVEESTADGDEDCSDSPRSEASQRSIGCDSLFEICSTCPVPSVAKEGILEMKQFSFFSIVPRSRKRFFIVREGCLEVWLTRKSGLLVSKEEDLFLRDLKDMDQHGNALTLKFINQRLLGEGPASRVMKLSAENDSDAAEWFEAIESVLRSMSMPINYSLCETPVFRPDVLQEFQRLVDHCFMSKSTRDRKRQALPNRLKVVRVVRVHNSRLLREYNNMQCQLAGELKDADRQKSYDILSPDVRTRLLDPPLQTPPELDDSTIERWLFHGTNPRALQGIAKSNFDLGCAGSGAGALYGKSIYCAGCSSKADEYTEEDASGVRGLLLCRAMLGKILYSSAKSPDVRMLEDQKAAQGCHSILGDRWAAAGTYREYIFGQKEQLYPEFIIYYQREY